MFLYLYQLKSLQISLDSHLTGLDDAQVTCSAGSAALGPGRCVPVGSRPPAGGAWVPPTLPLVSVCPRWTLRSFYLDFQFTCTFSYCLSLQSDKHGVDPGINMNQTWISPSSPSLWNLSSDLAEWTSHGFSPAAFTSPLGCVPEGSACWPHSLQFIILNHR